MGDESIEKSGWRTGPPLAYGGVSETADTAVFEVPLDGRLLDPVGLQTSRSRTRIGLSEFLPSAMIARPLNSLPFRCPIICTVSIVGATVQPCILSCREDTARITPYCTLHHNSHDP